MKTKPNPTMRSLAEKEARLRERLCGGLDLARAQSGALAADSALEIDWRKRYLDLEPEHRHIEQKFGESRAERAIGGLVLKLQCVEELLENNERKRESLQTELSRATLRAATAEREGLELHKQLEMVGNLVREQTLQIERTAKLIAKLRAQLKSKSKAR